jgi:hypothetical protein
MSFVYETIRINTRLDAITGSGHIVTSNKGDILADTGLNTTALGVGTDNQILVADSSESTGLKWATLDNTIIDGTANIDATKIADGSVTNTEFQRLALLASAAVGESDSQSLSNKNLIDNSTNITNNADNTKKVQFDVSNITASTTRIITVPDANLTLVGSDTAQTLSQKTIDTDSNTVTNIDNTNIKASAEIDASKIANGSVSNAEFQQLSDVNSAVVAVDDEQTLTQKTLTAPKIKNSINDDNGNELIKLTSIASAVNEIHVTNATSGSYPGIKASGNDTDINLDLAAKGSGNVVISGLKYPNGDGSTNQVLATNGAGQIGYANVDIIIVDTGTTTDNTETTIHTMETASDTSYILEAHVIGIRTDSGSETGGFVIKSVFRNNGGTLTKVGDDKMSAKDSPWDANCNISGTNVIIAVTGESSKTINWKVSCKATSMS